MKRILVPVDFSEACNNAISYAVEFAKKVKAHIYLLNVYDYGYVPNDPLVWVPMSDDLAEDHLQKLGTIREKIYKEHGKQVKIKCYSEPGSTT